MARVEHTCTGCVPIDASIIDVYVTLVETNKAVTNAEAGRVTAEGERVAAETERTATFTADHGRAVSDHSIAQQDHALAGTDHSASAAATASANAAAALANLKAELVQQRLDTADADHARAVGDHNTAVSDHSTASSDHTTAQSDHTTAGADHTRAETDHSTATSDHTASGTATAAATAAATLATEKAGLVQDKLDRADTDHTRAESDHTTAVSDHGIAGTDHTTATGDHTTASADHTLAGADHTTAAADHTQAASDHTLAAADHTTAGADHTQALADHEVMEGYDTRLTNTETEVSQLRQKVTDLQDGETVLQQQIDAIHPVVIEGNVTNAPDNEDITATPDNRLKFADRPATLTNKGYKILRADKTFASQVTDINTIYEIRYQFDLEDPDGETPVSIPTGCVLAFNGGKIVNGKIVGNGTQIVANDNAKIFKDIVFGDNAYQFVNDYVSVDWFDYSSDSDKIQSAILFCKNNRSSVKFCNREYLLDKTVIVDAESFQMYGNANGGEIGVQGLVISVADGFTSELSGNPLFYFCGSGSLESLGDQSFKIEGLQFRDCPGNDVFQLKYNSGPSRPFYINFCTFKNTKKAINILDNGKTTNVGFMHIENCTFQKVDWALFAQGNHALMGCTFTKNIAEQSEGCINLGYSDTHSGKDGLTPVPTMVGYTLSNNIIISDNLLEGTTDTIFISGSIVFVDISRNYFERGENTQKQFIVIECQSAQGSLSFIDNHDSNNVVNIYLPTQPLGRCLINRVPYDRVFPHITSHYNLFGKDNIISATIGEIRRPTSFHLFGSSQLASVIAVKSYDAVKYTVYDGEFLWRPISATAESAFLTVTGALAAGTTLYVVISYYFTESNRIILTARNKPTGQSWSAYEGIGSSETTIYGGTICCKYEIPRNCDEIDIRLQATKASGYTRMPKMIILSGGIVDNLLYEFSLPSFDVVDKVNQLPTTAPNNVSIFVKDIRKTLVRLNGAWVEEDGEPVGILRSGTTANRPTPNNAGFVYFDETIGKPIWYTGSGWVDATGTAV